MTDDLRDDLRDHLIASLNRRPKLLRSRQHAPELASHLVPAVLTYLVEELATAAQLFEECAENPKEIGEDPEQSWSQGVMFAVERLLARADSIQSLIPQGRVGGSE